MKILFINSIRRENYGGGEKWMLSAARGLKTRGHQVFIAGRRASIFLNKAVEGGLITWPVNIKRDVSPLSTIKIHAFLIRNQIDTLICNYNRDVRVAGLAAALAGMKHVYARHGLKIIKNTIRHTLPLRLLTKGIITNTNTIKDAYLKYNCFPQGFIHVLHNGISMDKTIQAKDFSQSFKNKIIVAAAGRLVKQKGFSYLIKAAGILGKRREDMVFLIYGEGETQNELSRQIEVEGVSAMVFLKGFASPLMPIIKGADIFILPSLSEGMPNVVMEAMALGTPVIATSVNGVSELMENNKNGIIVEPANPVQMARALEYLADNPDKRTFLAKNALKRMESFFTMEQMLDSLEKILY